MADPASPIGSGAMVADLGANLVTVLVILLAATAAQRHPETTAPHSLPALTATPLSGQGQSDLLYLRLRPDPAILTVELTAQGAFVPRGGAMLPLSQLAPPYPPRAVAFVFSPRAYGALRALTDANGITLQEVTVPDALRRPPADLPQSGFSTAFLALRAGDDPASIRPALLRLLTAGPAGAGLSGAEGAGFLAWLGQVAKTALNLTLFLAALALLRRLKRQALPPAP